MAEISELRKDDRYLIGERIIGSFANAEVQVVNVSEDGAQIAHAQPLRIATKSRLAFKRGPLAVGVQALVVWSKLSKTPNEQGKYLYYSGLRVEGTSENLASAIKGLAELGIIRRDADSLDRKRRLREERETARQTAPALRRIPTQELAPDTVLLVEHARERLRTNPDEAQKWFSRAYFAMQQGEVPQNVELPQHHRENVLAVWEYLERTVPLPVILKIIEGKK